jgi:hypothetical protein
MKYSYMVEVLYDHTVFRLERIKVISFIQSCLWDSNRGYLELEVVLIVRFQFSSPR